MKSQKFSSSTHNRREKSDRGKTFHRYLVNQKINAKKHIDSNGVVGKLVLYMKSQIGSSDGNILEFSHAQKQCIFKDRKEMQH